jgi:putative holliday junction resolvase
LRHIALDLGERRVGVAVSDPLGKTAQPYATLPNDDLLMRELERIALKLEAESFVVGLPVLMNGSEGAGARAAREFAARLEQGTGIPVELVDERLTTRQAESIIRAGGRAPADGESDRVAAALILKDYLDGKSGQ